MTDTRIDRSAVTDEPTDTTDTTDTTDRYVDAGRDGGDRDDDGGGDDGPGRPRRWHVDRTLVIVILLLGVGAFLLARGLLVGITGDERANLPALIESVDPVPESVQVLNQTSVFVDLASGYTGVLVIDDIEIETVNLDEIVRLDAEPGQQVDLPPVTIYEAGNATLTFTPNQNAPITQFVQGEHSAEVIYWLVEDGRERARTFTWTFDVV